MDPTGREGGIDMREIKFKAYWSDSCNVGWSEPFTLFDILNGQVKRCSNDEMSEYDDIQLAKAIVQYTGLKDRNGQEIYEGDIVEIDFDHEKFKMIYDDYKPMFMAKSQRTCKIAPDKDMTEKHFTVIGNIYENPELLEVD